MTSFWYEASKKEHSILGQTLQNWLITVFTIALSTFSLGHLDCKFFTEHN